MLFSNNLNILSVLSATASTVFAYQGSSNILGSYSDRTETKTFFKRDLTGSGNLTAFYNDQGYNVSAFVIPTLNYYQNTDKRDDTTVLWDLEVYKTEAEAKGLNESISSCISWSLHGVVSYADCMRGAIATALQVGTTNDIAIDSYKKIVKYTNDLNGDDSILQEAIRNLTLCYSNITGLPTATLLHLNGEVAINDLTNWPIHVVQAPDGTFHHISVMDITNDTVFHRINMGPNASELNARMASFQLENFSQNGIEWSSKRLDNTFNLNWDSNFRYMCSQIGCLFDDFSFPTYKYEIFSNQKNDSAIEQGFISPYNGRTFNEADITNLNGVGLIQVDKSCLY